MSMPHIDPAHLDLRLLRMVETVERLGSLSAASDELALSQPALSHAIARLRSVLGDPLFVRTPRGMRPTPRAEELARSTRRIQAFMREELGAGSAFDPASKHGRITFCMSDVGEMVFLPRLLGRIRQEAPRVDVRTVSLPPRRLQDQLDYGSVDLAIGYFPDLSTSGTAHEDLFERDFMCLASKSHPRLGNGPLSLATFLSEPHLVVSREGRVEELFERSLRSHGLSRRILLSVPHTFSMPAVLSNSDLIATVSRSIGETIMMSSNLISFPVPLETPKIQIAQHWGVRFTHDPARRWLRNIISEMFKE
jgi:DNA-binding transcriptional LysR family regulator